ncbi:MAG TPA: DUF2325 domain-containing protein [Stellaceae bacterium]|nr:DUF2325 domain-containing protein [Stellaceae bacterium]
MLIGTCLSVNDLRRLLRKADITVAPGTPDYDIHGYFVKQSGARSLLSKLIHKTLDRKYGAQIARFRQAAGADDLWAIWQNAVNEGDVAGAYWALLTHKATPRAMAIRAHNEVHMLSHLMGKSSREENRRVRQLEAECAALAERLAKMRSRAQTAQQEHDARIRTLDAQLAVALRTPPAIDRSEELRKRDAEIDRLKARCGALERCLRTERKRADGAEARLTAVTQEPGPPLEPLVSTVEAPAHYDPAQQDDDGDLSGHALLYVGGYRDVTPRLRAHVEAMRGIFLYHDGGIERQNGKLRGLVSQADAVFCPVNCVSHDACLRLKHLCKRQGKRFVLLRSAGFSGFVSALGEIVKGTRQGGVNPAASLGSDTEVPAPSP